MRELKHWGFHLINAPGHPYENNINLRAESAMGALLMGFYVVRCKHCGNAFRAKRETVKFCSRKCEIEAKKTILMVV
ncbi:MAG: hypothetical protein PHO71_24425 [Bacteroides sp.]|nr:hypothetical protein [Bacteroides sp.]